MDFLSLKAAVQRQFEAMARSGLYRTTVLGDALWATYLESFPPGSNPMFRERTEHDCSCCRHFVKTVGSLVSIVDGRLVSLWDVRLDDEPAYKAVATVMSALVKSHPIDNVFLCADPVVGTDRNYENNDGRVLTWDHFFLRIPLRNENPILCPHADIGPRLSLFRATHDVFRRGLEEISKDAIDTVLELIGQNSLYRGEEHEHAVRSFSDLKRGFVGAFNRDRFVWSRLLSTPESVSRIRNTAIGTLLVDLSTGVELEDAVRSFESKVAPTNYRRPTALVTRAMVDAARAKIAELGLTSALERRHATLRDVSVNDVLFADRAARRAIKGDVFDDVPTKPRSFDRVETIPIERFVTEVLSGLTSVEVMFEGRLAGNLVSLVAPVDPMSANLFKWGNRFSWSYNGDVADSIRERVKRAGGDVSGDLCCRLAWFNHDDLDFHMVEPGRYEINFTNKGRLSPLGGKLDVDMNAGGGTTREPVENIFYRSHRTMAEGIYHLYVHQFQRREGDGVGFEAEVDLAGDVRAFSYPKALRQGEYVTVARIEHSRAGGFKIVKSLPEARASRSIWGLETNQFHRVSLLMLSPNHWGERGVGNRHYFFVIEGCRNDGAARGFYNEFLKEELTPHRKVLEIVGSRTKVDDSEDQLSGLGFSSTQPNEVLVRVGGSFTRVLKVTI